jgi:hypothetical protein
MPTKAKIKTRSFDPADYIDNEEAAAAYIEEALDSGDPAFIADALGVVARARGMSRIARDTRCRSQIPILAYDKFTRWLIRQRDLVKRFSGAQLSAPLAPSPAL